MNQRWATPTPELAFFTRSWSGVALIRSGVQVELELALFSNSDSTPTDIMTSKRTTKKLHRCPSVNALEERKIEIYKEKENFHND